MIKKIVNTLIVFVLSLCLISCSFNPGSKKLTDCSLIHEEEFGGVYVTKTIEEFNKLGYAYGDSVDVEFSNGFKLIDLPYYNGYYVDAGIPLLVAYPGYDYIKVAINYGDDMWEVAGLNDDDTATITINKKAKYLNIQQASDIHYFDERAKYTTDEEFANFRNIVVGNIKEGILYRSASPCDNKHNRAPFVDQLMEQAGVKFIMNLADTKEKIDAYIAKEDFNSPYFLSLYQTNKFFLSVTIEENVTILAMNMNYRSSEFAEKIGIGFTQMANSEGAYLIHCLEGKDRTGFVCIVIEALLNASYQEIVDDYMLTYDNYYDITYPSEKYDIIKARNVDAMLQFIVGDDKDIKTCDLSEAAFNYLLNAGMSEDTINLLINKLSK